MTRFSNNNQTDIRTYCLPQKVSSEVECEDCGLDPVCQVLDYSEVGSGVPVGILQRRKKVSRGELLFKKSETFHSLYAVKSGSFKALIPLPDNKEQVIGFHLPGELIGTEGIATKQYTSSVRALVTSSVCELRLERLPSSGRSLTQLQESVIKLLSAEVTFGHTLAAQMIRQSADQRVAAFLLNHSQRLLARGFDGREFRLGMSRRDIASYLGLASETVTRVFTRLQRLAVVRFKGRMVWIQDAIAMDEIARAGIQRRRTVS